jgi:hypothetical protein
MAWQLLRQVLSSSTQHTRVRAASVLRVRGAMRSRVCACLQGLGAWCERGSWFLRSVEAHQTPSNRRITRQALTHPDTLACLRFDY